MSARAAIRAGMVTCAEAFQTANPTYLRAVHAVRPTRFSGDLPMCYIDFLSEDVLHTAGTQQREATPSFVIVHRPIENDEQTTAADAIADAFIEHLKDYAHIASNMVWSRMRVTDESIELGDGTVYPTIRFSLLDVTVMTGRTG